MRYLLIISCVILSVLAAGNAHADAKLERLKNHIYLDLKYGRVVIKLLPKLAPKHVKRVKRLTREGFYNGLNFHRVISGFMAQTGDPSGTGNGGSRYPDLAAEFSKKEVFRRGTVAAARTLDPNSANSQFFICYEAAPWLNGKYTIWGEVISGMQYVDLLQKGHPRSGTVSNPDKIIKMHLAYDDKKDQEEDKKKDGEKENTEKK